MARLHPWSVETTTIDFVQHINVAPEDVWPRLTTEEGLRTWLGVSTAVIPVRKGEPFCMRWEARGWASGKVDFGYEGTVERFQPTELLALNYRLPHSGVMTQLSIQLQQSFAAFGNDAGRECDLWLTHAGFPSDGVGRYEFDGHNRHWRQGLGMLAADLEGRPAKPQPYVLVGLKCVGGQPGHGLLIEDVAGGSPADLAGIRPGEILKSVNGRPLEALDDFHDWIDHCSVGDSGLFEFADRTITVPVESVEDAILRVRVRHADEWNELASLGKKSE